MSYFIARSLWQRDNSVVASSSLGRRKCCFCILDVFVIRSVPFSRLTENRREYVMLLYMALTARQATYCEGPVTGYYTEASVC
jgi:hypothetical protein